MNKPGITEVVRNLHIFIGVGNLSLSEREVAERLYQQVLAYCAERERGALTSAQKVKVMRDIARQRKDGKR